MGSSKYYRLWVRDGEVGSNWVEITKFEGLRFRHQVNSVPYFEATVYATTSTLQALMTANRIFRITSKESTNGKVAIWHFGRNSTGTGTATDSSSESSADANSQEIMTGRLSEPRADSKWLQNGSPVKYGLTGYGFMKSLEGMIYDSEATLTGSFNNILTRATDGILEFIGTGRVIEGDIDTGPTVTLLVKKISVLDILLTIARIGDATTKFPYFIAVTHNSSFLPVVSLFKPDNSLFETTNPFSGPDAGRVLISETELREFAQKEERDRVINKIKVRWAGMGTGVAQTDTAEATDTTFPEVKQKVVFAPLIQNDATAVLHRDTVLNMFKGTATGVQRVEAVLKVGELFEDFDGILMDQIGFQAGGAEKFQSKLLEYEYSQAEEALRVVAGIPKDYVFETLQQFDMAIKQIYSGMTSAVAKRIGSGTMGSATGNPSGVTDGSATSVTITTDPDFVTSTDEMLLIYFSVNSDSAGSMADIMIELHESGGGVTEVFEWRVNLITNTKMVQTYTADMLKSFFGADKTIDSIKLEVTNRSGANRNYNLLIEAWRTSSHFHSM